MGLSNLSKLSLIAITTTTLFHGVSEIKSQTITLAELNHQKRNEHIKTAVAKDYRRYDFILSQDHKTVDQKLHDVLKNNLPLRYQKYRKVIASSIKLESAKYGFDPLFLLAVIHNESTFGVHKIGAVGEIGLMQIRPSTASWITKKLGVEYKGKNFLFEPETNIRVGAAYINYLKNKFSATPDLLYLSAYNMGPTSVYKALKRNVIPKDYVAATMKKYKRYYYQLSKVKNNAPKEKSFRTAFMGRKLIKEELKKYAMKN
jgi:soluble lytic murein transglycosylase